MQLRWRMFETCFFVGMLLLSLQPACLRLPKGRAPTTKTTKPSITALKSSSEHLPIFRQSNQLFRSLIGSSARRLVGSSAGAGPSARQDGHPASRVVLRPHRGRSRAGHRTAWVRGARAGQGVLAVMLGEVTQNLYLIEIEQGNDHVRFILCHPSPF